MIRDMLDSIIEFCRMLWDTGAILFVVVAVGIVGAIFLAGNIHYSPQTSTITSSNVPAGYMITRYIDKEADVVCWVTPQGISCLPINQTKLDK